MAWSNIYFSTLVKRICTWGNFTLKGVSEKLQYKRTLLDSQYDGQKRFTVRNCPGKTMLVIKDERKADASAILFANIDCLVL